MRRPCSVGVEICDWNGVEAAGRYSTSRHNSRSAKRIDTRSALWFLRLWFQDGASVDEWFCSAPYPGGVCIPTLGFHCRLQGRPLPLHSTFVFSTRSDSLTISLFTTPISQPESHSLDWVDPCFSIPCYPRNVHTCISILTPTMFIAYAGYNIEIETAPFFVRSEKRPYGTIRVNNKTQVCFLIICRSCHKQCSQGHKSHRQ